jgi:hypothetical protein
MLQQNDLWCIQEQGIKLPGSRRHVQYGVGKWLPSDGLHKKGSTHTQHYPFHKVHR